MEGVDQACLFNPPHHRALYVYKSKRSDQAAIKSRIKDICETRVRYGYRRVHVLLPRDGWAANIKRVYRLYRELGLKLRNKAPKRRVKAKLREGRTDARQVNKTWAMDFVHDQLAIGRKIRLLTIVDTCSRWCRDQPIVSIGVHRLAQARYREISMDRERDQGSERQEPSGFRVKGWIESSARAQRAAASRLFARRLSCSAEAASDPKRTCVSPPHR